MAFYSNDPQMALSLRDLINRFEQEGRKNLGNNIAISWIRYNEHAPSSGSGLGAGWNENEAIYPASIVKLIYGVATERWLEKDLLIDNKEISRALYEMLSHSSNDATSYILDVLTGSTSGPSLNNESFALWKKQRQLINEWLQQLNWPELNNVNCCQKTWEESPYGREKDFYGNNNENRNSLNTISTARFLENLMTDNFLSPKANKRLKKCISRSLNPIDRRRDPNNQIDGFIGEGLPRDTQVWSKAGLMSEARHDAAWWSAPNGNPSLLVIFTQGSQLANDTYLLPALAHEINQIHLSFEQRA